MALFSFGKKDKNPPEAAAPVAKAPPTPPKIQNPPGSGPVPAVRPPQPAGLIPTTGMPSGAATTQPMVMPRGVGAGLKPSRPGVAQSSRSTQRIVLPAGAGQKNATKSVSTVPSGRINLPIGMILRCLPQEVLAADISEFEASGAAATEIGIPMNMILSQLPSGKVEMPLSDLVPHFPAGYLQPTESIASYLPNLINLPLMDVVMRIPPDLLALRPDQKDVDAAVINMADPFTEEILREQAEAARRQAAAQANIIDEGQVQPAEEFVPQAQAAPAPAKTIAPPPRPPSIPLPSPRPMAPSAPPAPLPASARSTGPVGVTSPSMSARTISPSGSLAVPTRATTAIPTRAAAAAPTLPTPPLPPVARQTGSLPRTTGALPPVSAIPRQSVSAPLPPPITPPQSAFVPPPPVVAELETPPTTSEVTPPDNNADDLQRLAALAMAQMGEEDGMEPVPPSLAELSVATAKLPASQLPSARLPEVPESTVQPITQFVPPPPQAPEPVAEEPEPEPEPIPEPETEPESFIMPPPIPAPVAVQAPPPPVPKPVAFTPPPPVPAPVPIAAPPAPVPAPVRAVVPPPTPAPVAVPKPPAPVAVAPPPPVAAPVRPPVPVVAAPTPAPQAPAASAGSVAFNLNTCTSADLVQNIPGCFKELADSIIEHRTKIGSFKRLEDLLDVPGMTKAAYTNLTGEAPPDNRIPLSLSELLGFPAEQHISLKDVTDRIACWPDVTGCILSQSSGLSLVGTAPEGLDKAAIVAFAPKMFEELNKSFSEITGVETDGLVIPSPGNSFHIFRNKDLYLIILSRLPQMPERHMKVARFVLAALSIRRD